MAMKFLIILFACFFSVNLAYNLPFTLCHLSKGPEAFNECVKNAVGPALIALKDGFSELGVPVLEPTLVKKVTIGGNGGSVDLNQEYNDAQVYGAVFSKFESADISLKPEDCHMTFVTHTDKLVMSGDHYKFEGKMLLFTINGFGKFNITSENMKAVHKLTCEFFTKNSKRHIRLTNWQELWELEKISYHFENLVDGNRELSDTVLQVMNDNALEVYGSVKDGYEKTFASVYLQVANLIFTKVPFDEIFLP